MTLRLASLRSLVISSLIILSLWANAQGGDVFGRGSQNANGTRVSATGLLLGLAAPRLSSTNLTTANAPAGINQMSAVHTVRRVRAHRGAIFASATEASAPLAVEAVTDNLVLENVFHIVGVPGLRRNARVDLNFDSKALHIQQGKKERLLVPYGRMRHAEMLDGTRSYAKATYGAVLTGGVAGALLLLKKQRVDTLVFDYVNDRGGQMGLVLQVPQGKGAACRDRLRRSGVATDEPEPMPTPGPEAPR